MIVRGYQRRLKIEELRARGIPGRDIEFILDHKSILEMSEKEREQHECPAQGWIDLVAPTIFTINTWRRTKSSWVLILCGPTGSGKTFAASWAAAMDGWTQNAPPGTQPKDASYQPCMVNERELALCTDADLVERYSTCSFLALDDIATESEPLRGFMMDRIAHVLSRRYDDSLPTLITANASVRAKDGTLVDVSADHGQSILERYGFRMASRFAADGKSPIQGFWNAKNYRNDKRTQEQRRSYETWKKAKVPDQEPAHLLSAPIPAYASEETRARVSAMIQEFVAGKRLQHHDLH